MTPKQHQVDASSPKKITMILNFAVNCAVELARDTP